jgi:hypothetical protein
MSCRRRYSIVEIISGVFFRRNASATLSARSAGSDVAAEQLLTATGYGMSIQIEQELEAHVEGRETWRVLEVTYPDEVPAHTKVQKLYFGDDFMLRRLDYVPIGRCRPSRPGT